MLDGLLKIGGLLDCPKCHLTLRQTRIVAECGHRFCKDCITHELQQKGACPVCKKSADIQNLRKDAQHDNLVIYVNQLKRACLPHTLTPLEYSLQKKNQPVALNDYAYSMEDDIHTTANMTVDEDTAIDDLTDIPPLATTVSKKRHLDNVDEDEELESEFDDTIPVNKKVKIVNPADKQKLFDPKALLADILPTHMSPISDLTPSPAQRTPSTPSRSGRVSQSPSNQSGSTETPTPTSTPPVTSRNDQSVSQAIDLPSLETSATNNDSTSPITLEEKDASMVPVLSDNEEEGEKTSWECAKCHYQNKPYIQTCLICRHYRKGDFPVIQDTTTALINTTDSTNEKPAEASVEEEEKKEYELTAADEDSGIANDIFTAPRLRRRSEDTNKLEEAHIMYTGLTPEDEVGTKKKVHKAIEEAALTNLKITIQHQMRDFNEVTHILTSVNRQKLCKRTLKYLQAILEGKWVVDPNWLVKSVRAKKWQPEVDYEAHGDHQSGETKAPRNGRERKDDPLLKDMKFFFLGDFSGKHKKSDLVNLIQAGGGKVLKKRPASSGRRLDAKNDSTDTEQPIVIMAAESKKKPAWLHECQVRDPTWLIDCVSKLEIS